METSEEVFQFFEDIKNYVKVDDVESALEFCVANKGRRSFTVADRLHVDASIDHKNLSIYNVAVKHERQGYGTQCIQKALQWCQTRHMTLRICGPFTPAGRSFCDKMGCEPRDAYVKMKGLD